MDLSKLLASDQAAVLLDILAKGVDHHDEAKPEVVHDLPALSKSAPGLGDIGQALLLAVLSNKEIVGGLFALLLSRLSRKPAETLHNPPTIFPPTVVPVAPKEPSRPDEAAASAQPALQSWVEEFWHDLFRNYPDQVNPPNAETGEGSDWAASGQPIAENILNGVKGAPNGPVVRFMTGVLPKPSTVPFRDERPAPFAIDHVFDLDGDVHVLSSLADGSTQPLEPFAHVQFGPRFQDSHGWDVTIRIHPWSGGPRKLTYHSRQPQGLAVAGSPESFTIGGK